MRYIGMWRSVSLTYTVREDFVRKKGCLQKNWINSLQTAGNIGLQLSISMKNLLTGTLIEKMKENGIGISVWTVNEPEQIEKFVKCGIHNITTRNLTAALAVREKRNNHDFI